jgi:hypothetical protein
MVPPAIPGCFFLRSGCCSDYDDDDDDDRIEDDTTHIIDAREKLNGNTYKFPQN